MNIRAYLIIISFIPTVLLGMEEEIIKSETWILASSQKLKKMSTQSQIRFIPCLLVGKYIIRLMDEKLSEIDKLLSSENLTKAAIESAREDERTIDDNTTINDGSAQYALTYSFDKKTIMFFNNPIMQMIMLCKLGKKNKTAFNEKEFLYSIDLLLSNSDIIYRDYSLKTCLEMAKQFNLSGIIDLLQQHEDDIDFDVTYTPEQFESLAVE